MFRSHMKFRNIRSLLVLLFLWVLPFSASAQVVRIGAKHFNEGYLLAEILAQLLEANNYKVERNFNLGGTLICFTALENGEIDVYPEYTGTIAEQILHVGRKLSWPELRTLLKNNYHLDISRPFGFNNTYALALRREMAGKLSLTKISQLRKHENLRFALSYEFLKRRDGWENLIRTYNLPHEAVGIEHGLAYQALAEQSVDVIDVYSTDGEIPRYDLTILQDDLEFFPVYQAIALYRRELPAKISSIFNRLAHSLNEKTMQDLNAAVVFEGRTHAEIAHRFLLNNRFIDSDARERTDIMALDILAKTKTHLQLTFIALLGAMIIAIPLGVIVYHYGSLAKPILYITGLLQTIPSIALLAFMIPLFGIGVMPAVIALFLYALLPILRNTTSALFAIDPALKKVATGIGMTKWQKLIYVEFPLAMPNVIAGIKTAAVINIGTATLAAFIGAGGLGEFIVTGLALNDSAIILQGAIPAALLAILVEFLFEMLEKILVPKHLQQKMVH